MLIRLNKLLWNMSKSEIILITGDGGVFFVNNFSKKISNTSKSSHSIQSTELARTV